MNRFKVPHAFIFLFWIIIFCSILTYFVPSGSFERTTRSYGGITQTVVVPGSYKAMPKHLSLKAAIAGEEVEGKASPVSLLGILEAIPKGLAQSSVLVFYVFIIGSLFTFIHHTGAINGVLFSLIRRFQNRPMLLFFLVYMLLFSGSAFLGIGPETIAFVPIFLYLSKRMGFDRMFAVGLLCIPVFMGWSTGVTNPFNVQVAQIIAELPAGSGIGMRLLLFVVMAALGFGLLMRYGLRVQRDPNSSLMPKDAFGLEEFGAFEETKLERRHIYILSFFGVAYAAILVAVQTIGWGLIEMSACFIGIMIVTMFLSGMGGDKSMAAIIKGLEIMIIPALIVGVARGISVVLQEGMVIDTILYQASSLLETLPRTMAAEGMLIFQSFMNFFIPSASGQALVSMPLLTPLSDILGISRQTTVLAFILGDGLSNMIIPTNGILMALLGIAGVPFEKWVRFAAPFFVSSTLVAMGFIALAIATGY